MKKIVLFTGILLFFVSISAVNVLLVFNKDGAVVGFLASNVDSITFSKDNANMFVFKNDNSVSSFVRTQIDSFMIKDISDTVKIHYNGENTTIENPLSNFGVKVTQSGGDIVINSSILNLAVKYLLSGSSPDASLKVYSNTRLEIIFNGLDITNTDGPAINIQTNKRVDVTLLPGTSNHLKDGSVYSTSTEDQKGTFFSEGQLIFSGSGSLNIESYHGHALCSDDFIQINDGNITVESSLIDAIHVKDYFKMYGGVLQLTPTSDGIDSEGKILISGGSISCNNAIQGTKAISCDSTLTINGGKVNLIVAGLQSKGLKSKGEMCLSNGNITVSTVGSAALSSGGAVSYCTAIKCDSSINLSGATITINGTGAANKGISSDTDIFISGGYINITESGAGNVYTNSYSILDSYSSAGIEADGNIAIDGGNITIVTSGSASKGISSDGNLTIGSLSASPTIYVKNTGTRLLVSGSANYATANYAEPKNLKSDGILTIAGGIIKLNATQQGATTIDSDSLLFVTGGIVNDTISGNQSKGIKSTRAMTLSGGTVNVSASGGATIENLSSSTYDPSYCTAIKSDADINLTGSSVTITHSGGGGKGISSATGINVNAGVVKVITSGTGTTYNSSSTVKDAYSAACLSSANINIMGGTLTCSSSGAGGKGLKADNSINVGNANNSPIIGITTTGSKFLVSSSGSGMNATTDYCHPKAIVSDGTVTVNNGNITISSADDGVHAETLYTQNGGQLVITTSVEGVESKTITINNGYLNIAASDDGINATAGTVSGGTESDDGSYFYMKGGIVLAEATSGDAVDSNGSLSMTGGVLATFGPSNNTNEDVDVNGNIVINGGTLLGACSNSSMFETISSTSQVGVNIKSSSSIASAGSYFRVQDATGTEIGTFITPRAAAYFHVSSSSMKKGTSYTIYTGGTYTGGTTYGNTANGAYCKGGTYSGGTSKKTFTTSSSAYITTTN